MEALEELARRLGRRAERSAPLGALTTYRVGGPAALLVEVRGEAELEALRSALGGLGVPVLVLGRGSNLLVADAGFPGLVVRPLGDLEALEIAAPAEDGAVVVRAGAALPLPQLARRTVEASLRGLEWAVGVPGSVGGALRMNAGGHGSDVAASLLRYRWVDLGGPEGGVDPAGRLELAYRHSSLRPTQLVVWAEFGLHLGDRQEGRALVADIVRWRRQHQPGGSNAGSVFTNPAGDSAGRLIEAAGLKGLRLGTAQVSDKHANFIQADEGGSANDVYRLMEHVREQVHRRTGVLLRSEVRLVGFGAPQRTPAGETGAR